MITRILATALLGMMLIVTPTQAQVVDLKAFAEAESECTTWVEDMGPEGWSGWQRNFGNGYADNFHFYDGQLDQRGSVLQITRFIDGYVVEVTRWCYRVDGTLATIQIGMSSPDMIDGSEGSYITREGRLYVDEAGKTVAIRGWMSDSMSQKIGAIDSPDHMVARDCNPVDLRLTVADAQREMESQLGDIEGTYPTYEPNELDWCAVAVEGP